MIISIWQWTYLASISHSNNSEALQIELGVGQMMSNKMQKLVPVGEVVGIIKRSGKDMVVSIADEDSKALQSRQLTSRSVSASPSRTSSVSSIVINQLC